MVKNTKSDDKIDFESALLELESIVERMEQGNQNLEESLNDFERGVKLSKQCQLNLKQAEQRVEKILNPQSQSEPFNPDET